MHMYSCDFRVHFAHEHAHVRHALPSVRWRVALFEHDNLSGVRYVMIAIPREYHLSTVDAV